MFRSSLTLVAVVLCASSSLLATAHRIALAVEGHHIGLVKVSAKEPNEECITQLKSGIILEGGRYNMTAFWGTEAHLPLPFSCDDYTYHETLGPSKGCMAHPEPQIERAYGGPGKYLSSGAGGFTVLVRSTTQDGMHEEKVVKATSGIMAAYTECLTLKRLAWKGVENVVRCEAICMHGYSDQAQFASFVVSPYLEGAFQSWRGNRLGQEMTGGEKRKIIVTMENPQECSMEKLQEKVKEAASLDEFFLASSRVNPGSVVLTESNNKATHLQALFNAVSGQDRSYPVTVEFELWESMVLEDAALKRAAEQTLKTGFQILQADVVNMDQSQNILHTRDGQVIFIDFGKTSGTVDRATPEGQRMGGEYIEDILDRLPKEWWATGEGEELSKAKQMALLVLQSVQGEWTDLISQTIMEYQTSAF